MTNIDLLLWSKSPCFACINHRWGLGRIETSRSGTNHAVLHAQNERWGLGPMETCYSLSKRRSFASKNHRWVLGPKETSNSDANHDVLHAQNDRWGLGAIEICNSSQKDVVLHPKTTDECWDPKKLVILMLITMFCMHKTTGEVWEP